MNIAAYCRVSTNKEDQLNSLEVQKSFFEEYARKNDHSLVRVYADEGISGTKTKNRDATFCLYDVTADDSGGGIETLEEQIMEEQFKKRLTRLEAKLYTMAINGYPLAQIADVLKISEKEIEIMALEIGQKRQNFYQAA